MPSKKNLRILLVLFALALLPVAAVAASDSSPKQGDGPPAQDPNRVLPVSMTEMERISAVPRVAPTETDLTPLDNKPGAALETQCGWWWYGTINKKGDVDYYKFYAQRGETFMAAVHGWEWGTGLEPAITLYDVNGKTALDYSDYYDSLDPLIHYTFYNEGWYYLAVRGYADVSVGDYYFNLEKPIYLSTRSGGSVGGIDFTPGDVLQYNSCGDYWDMFLNSGSLGFNGNLRAFALTKGRTALVSFDKPQTFYGETLSRHDVAECYIYDTGWDAGWDCYQLFDGEDAGLTTASEAINSLAVSPYGELAMTFVGSADLPYVAGTVANEDVMGFYPYQFGPDTDGYFYYWFDGSDENLGKVATEGLWFNQYWYDIYQVFNKSIKVGNNVKLDKSDVGVCYSWGWQDYSYCGHWWEMFDATDAGFNGNIQVDAIDLGGTVWLNHPYNPYPAPPAARPTDK